jgi:hypothetical protein
VGQIELKLRYHPVKLSLGVGIKLNAAQVQSGVGFACGGKDDSILLGSGPFTGQNTDCSGKRRITRWRGLSAPQDHV